tara:strand:+ start:287 stop:472 length:186 start_codon:yes stop_codon:yes gene_type:complete
MKKISDLNIFSDKNRKFLLMILNISLVIFISLEIIILNSVQPQTINVDTIEDHGTKDDGEW